MKACVVQELSGPSGMSYMDVPDVTPGPESVLVDVRAAGVCFPDLLLSKGEYQLRLPPPFIPGMEVAGVVAAAPDGSGLAVGQRVCASVLGGYAEQVVAPVANVKPSPAELDDAEAVSLLVNYHTMYFAFERRAALRPGETVLVLGAAGGVGLAAVDIAVLMGARVIAAASGAEKLEVCRQRGAEACIDYDREDLKARLKEITGEAGAQVVLDPVGGRYSEPALRGLGRGGRFITLGYAAGEIPKIPLNLVMLKGITVQGMEIRTFAADYPDAIERDDAELHELFATGKLRPYIGARFPLEQAAAALRYVADRKAVGKVVVTMD